MLKTKPDTISKRDDSTRVAPAGGKGKQFVYSRIAEELHAEIASRMYASGRLPTELVLSVRHQVSVGTMRKALDLLVAKSIVIRKRGSGTYVNPDFNDGQEQDNSRRTHLIGYLSCTGAESSPGNFFNRLMIGVHQAVERSGYALAVSHIHRGTLPIPISRQRVDGLVVAGTYWGPGGRIARHDGLSENKRLMEQVLETGLPVVTISNPCDLPGLHRVNVNYDPALHRALSYLKEKGHRKIALFGGPAGWPAFGRRIEAFVSQCHALGLQCDESNLCIYERWADQDYAQVTRQAEAFIRSHPEMTAGIVISGLPQLIVSGIEQAGRRFPENFSLISFIDVRRQDVEPHEFSNVMQGVSTEMSTLEMPVLSMARIAVNRLVALLEGRRFATDESHILVHMDWSPGASVQPFAAG